ncbi:MAG: glucose 1-dehydrogenase [Clostridia bacterium]|jgi:2-deoxy-D-gluconate 3-dehydrogenase|nr:glucose 1-dehydrogenase [Clostridia bacterium]MBQ4248614.1 glucose 1-dehydrogenase [Clostridia bacterium]
MTINEVTFPSFDLKGKVAIVTGGTKGIGYQIAVSLAKFGADVVVAARNADDCKRVSEEIRGLGVRSEGIPTDVTDMARLQNLIDKTVEIMGKLDIMVANAGSAVTAKAVDITPEQWDKVLNLDLKAVFFCDTAAAKQMIKQGTGGRIINVASAAGLKGTKRITPYSAAKAGVVNVSKSLALEWGKYDITVNCICPGYVRTEINADQLDNPKVRDALLSRTALNRFAKLEEIGAAAVFLASDMSGYMTGSNFVVDGGSTAG